MTKAEALNLLDLAVSTVVPLGLDVAVKAVGQSYALVYGATQTEDSERAFMDFQLYGKQHMDLVNEDHEAALEEDAYRRDCAAIDELDDRSRDWEAEAERQAEDISNYRHGFVFDPNIGDDVWQ